MDVIGILISSNASSNLSMASFNRRQNSQKPLNGKLLRIVHESDAFSDAVYSLANHPFMDKLVTPFLTEHTVCNLHLYHNQLEIH